MFKLFLKIVMIVAIAATLSFGVEKCTKDFIQPVEASEVSDWKKCSTKVTILNTTDTFLTYHVKWVDHDVEKLALFLLPRCGGELGPHKADIGSKDFRLCLGRHIVTFSTGKREYSKYMFTIERGTTEILITPKKAIPIHAASEKAASTSKVAAKDISLIGLVNDQYTDDIAADIKQTINQHFRAFSERAMVTNYGKSVILHTGISVNNAYYTMSVRGNSYGIVSIDFTKQVTMAKGIVDIYYEGVKGSGYYCYAKQLRKSENYGQVDIDSQSIFEQVIVILFLGGEVS